ncbi:MAG: nicotinate (nicotinamide) nucleotide adenylyltransferase [Thermoanaerobaculia bacterium]
MRVGLYGGAFDPIHRGHLAPVREALQELRLDEVVYLPTANPPHKGGRELAPALARYAMVELALLEDRRLRVSPHELVARPAYTIETVEHFHRLDPAAEIFLLLGADAFLELPTWRRWQELPARAVIAVLRRPEWLGERFERALTAELGDLLESGRAVLLSNTTVTVAATDLRARLARGERPSPVELPAAVLQYIEKYALYR